MEKKEIELVCAKCGAISQKFEQVDTLLIRRCIKCGGVVFRINEGE